MILRSCAAAVGLLLFVFLDSSVLASATWQTLTSCRLLPNQSNDGDSFHVQHEGKEYIFRLYFVDTPECDNGLPDRVAQQAAYWRIPTEVAIKLGKAAARFTTNQLQTPFTILTRWHKALGRSKLPRHYAFVIANGDDLAESLTRLGLARVHGTPADRPAGPDRNTETMRLMKFEQEAKTERRGGWAIAETFELGRTTSNVPGSVVRN